MRNCTNIQSLIRMARLREAKLAAAVYVALAINKGRKVERKCWVKNWVKRRDRQGHTRSWYMNCSLKTLSSSEILHECQLWNF